MTAKSPSVALKRALDALTPDEARTVAKRAGTTREYLRHVEAGRRRMSCELALDVATALGKPSLQAVFCPGCAKRVAVR